MLREGEATNIGVATIPPGKKLSHRKPDANSATGVKPYRQRGCLQVRKYVNRRELFTKVGQEGLTGGGDQARFDALSVVEQTIYARRRSGVGQSLQGPLPCMTWR
jgi:hypothetical protein